VVVNDDLFSHLHAPYRAYALLSASERIQWIRHQGVTTLRQCTRITARQLEVRMLVIDEIHSILAGTFREQRIVLNANPFFGR
jgi:hypothetical protein